MEDFLMIISFGLDFLHGKHEQIHFPRQRNLFLSAESCFHEMMVDMMGN